jgi:hypothetical protein
MVSDVVMLFSPSMFPYCSTLILYGTTYGSGYTQSYSYYGCLAESAPPVLAFQTTFDTKDETTNSTSTSSTTSSSPSSVASSTSATPSATSISRTSSSGTSQIGIAVGISIGVCVILACIAFSFYHRHKAKANKRWLEQSPQTFPLYSSYMDGTKAADPFDPGNSGNEAQATYELSSTGQTHELSSTGRTHELPASY